MHFLYFPEQENKRRKKINNNFALHGSESPSAKSPLTGNKKIQCKYCRNSENPLMIFFIKNLPEDSLSKIFNQKNG